MPEASTSTSATIVCEKCEEREKFSNYTESESFRVAYLNAITYINCCHSLMNELLKRKTGKDTLKLPEVPSFLGVVAALQDEKGVVTESPSQCNQSCGDEITINNTIKQVEDYTAEMQSDVSDEDMDRYAQELLLTSSNNAKTAPPTQCFQIQTTNRHTLPEKKQQKRNHLTNLNLLKQQLHDNDEDGGSDTDYIPSDDECDAPPKQQQQQLEVLPQLKSSIPISHPLKLNQRSIHMLDENAIHKIGLFNQNGELHMDAIKVLEAERHYRANDTRNKQFRRRRTSTTVDSNKVSENKRSIAVSESAAELSDVKSESELQMVCSPASECDVGGVVKVISGLKGVVRKM